MLINKGKAQVESALSSASYVAISKVVGDVNFSEFFSVTTDSLGNVQMVASDSLKLNNLSYMLATQTHSAFKVIEAGGVGVPLGAFTGISFLSGLGKEINVKMIKVESVRCEFVSSFTACGINQTKHSLYLNVIPECTLVVGLKSVKLNKSIQYLCYENLILGKVPENYFNIVNGCASVN